MVLLCCAQKLSDSGKLSLLQEMYREWPFMQVTACIRFTFTSAFARCRAFGCLASNQILHQHKRVVHPCR